MLDKQLTEHLHAAALVAALGAEPFASAFKRAGLTDAELRYDGSPTGLAGRFAIRALALDPKTFASVIAEIFGDDDAGLVSRQLRQTIAVR